MKILILGSQGNLGQDLVSVFSAAGHDVVGCDRDELDVTDHAAARAMIGRGFSAVINAVAYNNVDAHQHAKWLSSVTESRPSSRPQGGNRYSGTSSARLLLRTK